MAIIDDEYLYVVDEADHGILYHYSLSPADVTPVTGDTAEITRRLEKRLYAFLQCALADLRAMRAGPDPVEQARLTVMVPRR